MAILTAGFIPQLKMLSASSSWVALGNVYNLMTGSGSTITILWQYTGNWWNDNAGLGNVWGWMVKGVKGPIYWKLLDEWTLILQLGYIFAGTFQKICWKLHNCKTEHAFTLVLIALLHKLEIVSRNIYQNSEGTRNGRSTSGELFMLLLLLMLLLPPAATLVGGILTPKIIKRIIL